MHPSRQLFLCLVAFVSGVTLRSFWPWAPTAEVFFIGLVLLVVFLRQRPTRLVVCLGLSLLAGVARCDQRLQVLSVPPGPIDASAVFTGQVVHVDARPFGQTVRLGILDHDISRTLRVTMPLYPLVEFGDNLTVNCQLAPPAEVPPSGDWPCRRVRLVEREANPGSGWLATIHRLREVILTRINELMPEPHASFMAGLLLGSRGGITDELRQAFTDTGVTHIIAVSGFNLTIIAASVERLLGGLVGRKPSMWLTMGLLIGFVVLSGASASVVRAGIMVSLMLVAGRFGRRSSSQTTIVLAAAVMLIVHPEALRYDAGFQLSFLATAGLLTASQPLAQRLSWLPERWGIRESAATTMAASLLTTPLILFLFGRLSLVALIVNVCILWLVPIAMGVGFLSLLASLVTGMTGQIAAGLAWLVLTTIMTIVRFFAEFAWASVELTIQPWHLLAAYGLIGISLWRMIAAPPQSRPAPVGEHESV